MTATAQEPREKEAALQLTGTLVDLICLQIARALIERVEVGTEKEMQALQQAEKHLFHATFELEGEAEEEITAAIREALSTGPSTIVTVHPLPNDDRH